MYGAYAYDTNVSSLVGGGLTKKQAEIIVGILNQKQEQTALKDDLRVLEFNLKTTVNNEVAELGQKIESIKYELKTEIALESAKLRQEIAEVKTEIKQEIAEVKTEIREVEAKLESRIDKLELATKADFRELKTEMRANFTWIKAIGGSLFVIVLAQFLMQLIPFLKTIT